MQKKTGLLVDVETTGLGPDSDEIIELAMMLFSYCEETGDILDILEQDSFLREPLSTTALKNYDRAYQVHGIPFELVQGKSFLDEKILPYFSQSNSVFAHNASFDRSFLYRMFPEVNELDWYCTMRSIQWKNHGFQNSKLLTLLSAHEITNHQTHRALDDITYLMELLKKSNPNGELYLRESLQSGPMRKYQPAPTKYKRIHL